VLWILVNLWWLYPLWQTRNITTGSSINATANFASLEEVSKYFTNLTVWTLKQTFLFGPQGGRPFVEFYSVSHVYDVSIAALLLVLIGIIVSIRKLREKKIKIEISQGYLFFLLLLFSGWFISKGTNPPFGKEFYWFIFKYISVLQIFRNPYEKFGSVFVLAYAVIFSIGVVYIAEKLKKFKYPFIFVVLFIFCGYLLKPMWNGQLFTDNEHMSVPSYYQNVNNYIDSDDSVDTRLFQLPFLRASEISYDWNYTGEEPTEFLFDNPSVARTFSNDFMDTFYYKLGDPLYFRESKYFSNLLAIMDVKYIILHKDVVLTAYYQENVDDTRMYIKNWSGVKYVYDNGELEVYKLNNNLIPGRVYIVDKLLPASNLNKAFSIISSFQFNPTDAAVFISSENKTEFSQVHLEKPKYQIIKLSNSHYLIKIKNSKNPFVVVLANNFNSVWTATVEDQVLTNHFIVNGYANAWLVKNKGSYIIDIYYKVW